MKITPKGPFGEWLYSKIIEDDLSLIILANDLGINRQTLYNHIEGKWRPNRTVLKYYADYFGEDRWYLYQLSRGD